MSVLIVDDEEFIRKILGRIVRREGFAVTEACDGLEALELLKAQPFHFVISDIKMPRMDGLELLAAIKSEFPLIKVLMITGYPGDYSAWDIISAGADHYISKPFKNTEIATTLKTLAAGSIQPKVNKPAPRAKN